MDHVTLMVITTRTKFAWVRIAFKLSPSSGLNPKQASLSQMGSLDLLLTELTQDPTLFSQCTNKGLFQRLRLDFS